MRNATNSFSEERPWGVPEVMALENYPALATAWKWSWERLTRMRACLADLPRRAPEVAAVAVSGSLGRLEAGPYSDGDLIVVLSSEASSELDRTAGVTAVWDALAPLNLPRPQANGIFATAVTRAELCDPASRGRVVEDRALFGKRIQLLLDTQPVHGPDAYAGLVTAVIERYAAGFVAHDATKEWVYLLNDLVRYFRSLCLEAQWNFSPQGGGWYIKSLKLRHSRVAMYAGLLFLLGECSREKNDKVGWLTARVHRTPLERIAEVYRGRQDPHFNRVASAYDRFLAGMNDPSTRAALALPLHRGLKHYQPRDRRPTPSCTPIRGPFWGSCCTSFWRGVRTGVSSSSSICYSKRAKSQAGDPIAPPGRPGGLPSFVAGSHL